MHHITCQILHVSSLLGDDISSEIQEIRKVWPFFTVAMSRVVLNMFFCEVCVCETDRNLSNLKGKI